MAYTRRTFLKTGAVTATSLAAAGAAPPFFAMTSRGSAADVILSIQDDRIKALALRAVDAAREAGAQYADVRLVHSHVRLVSGGVSVLESMTVGVRALVDGYWGFASSAIWSPDEMVRLSREAVQQARVNVRGQERRVELAPIPVAATGHWRTPVEIDPFAIHPDEVSDHLASLAIFTHRRVRELRLSLRSLAQGVMFTMQQNAFASTDDAYCTQQLYRSAGSFGYAVEDPQLRRGDAGELECLSVAGVGWELYKKQPVREEIQRELQASREHIDLPIKSVDVGRYETVFDASSIARLMHGTIGAATELDRVLGFEANAGGTSYINDPLGMVGVWHIGSPLVTITANRVERGGAATVHWDDEGVRAQEFPLVREGRLVNLVTNREYASTLASYYVQQQMAVQSQACATGGTDFLGGMYVPLPHTPNLVLQPGRDTWNFESGMASIRKGIAFRNMNFDMDFQQLNGLGTGKAYEIKDGRRIAVLAGGGILFRAPEMWKNVTAVGGTASARRCGLRAIKGEPPQTSVQSVTAVPAMISDVTIVDITRKA